MTGHVLQEWITVRASGTPDFVQDPDGWTDCSAVQDAVFWIDIREVTLPGGGGGNTLTLKLQTAPTRDDGLFQTAASVSLSTTPGLVVPLPKVLLASAPSVPLAAWLRWVLTPSANLAWSATFRVMVALNETLAGRGSWGSWQRSLDEVGESGG